MAATVSAPELLTADEAATVVRVGRRAVYGLCAAGELRHVRLGSGPKARIRIAVDALEELPATPRTGPSRAVEAPAYRGVLGKGVETDGVGN